MRGTPSTSATVLMAKLVCSCVSLNRLLSTTLALASRFSVMTSSVLPPDDASLTSAMPSRSPPSTSSWMRPAMAEQLVWYGISVTTISMAPRRFSSMVAVARTLTLPRPVR